jgi:hypothetical protein
MNPRQLTHVSLNNNDIDAIVFWTRNPRPIFTHLKELDELGYRYYFQFTVMDNPPEIDTSAPSIDFALKAFRELSQRIGSSRVIWRYDPIVLSDRTGVNFHISKFRSIANELQGLTDRCVVSIVDKYRKSQKRLHELQDKGIKIVDYAGQPNERFTRMMTSMHEIACNNGMQIYSCAETLDLTQFGIMPGKCIDPSLLEEVFGIRVTQSKDKTQREACGCVKSQDIGIYNTCLFGCQYCYATSSFEIARRNFNDHNPESPSLIGWYDVSVDNMGSVQLRLQLEDSDASQKPVPADT